MYYKLPIKERMDLIKSYKKANPDMSYRDMVKDYNDSYEKFKDGGYKSEAEYKAHLLDPYSVEKRSAQIAWLNNNKPITYREDFNSKTGKPIVQKHKYDGIQKFGDSDKVPFMKKESDKIIAQEKMLASLKPRDFAAEKANYETQTRGANQMDGSGISSAEMAYRAIKLADPTFVSNVAEVSKDAFMGNEQNGLNIFGAIPIPYIGGIGKMAKVARKWYYYDKIGDLTNKGLDIVQEIK